MHWVSIPLKLHIQNILKSTETALTPKTAEIITKIIKIKIKAGKRYDILLTTPPNSIVLTSLEHYIIVSLLQIHLKQKFINER